MHPWRPTREMTRRFNVLTRYVASAVVVLVAACGPPSPGPVVQRLLDAYAPALPLGQRVTAEARDRYRLEVAPYEGYGDSSYQGLDSVRVLSILVDKSPGDETGAQVSWYARVKAVTLHSPTAATTARIDARVRAVLGVPRVACYTDGLARRVETRYWPAENGRGILLLVFRDSLPDPPNSSPGTPPFERGWAIITFGAEPMTSEHVTLKPCD